MSTLLGILLLVQFLDGCSATHTQPLPQCRSHTQGLITSLSQHEAPKPEHAMPYTPVLISEAAGIHYLSTAWHGGGQKKQLGVDAKLPMLIAIHGLGYRPRLPEEDMLQLKYPVRIVALRGPLRSGRGYGWFNTQVRDHQPEVLASEILTQVEQIKQSIDVLLEQWPTCGKPLVLGFSQGGMLTLATALHAPERVSHVFPLATWIPAQAIPTRISQPFLPGIQMMHGEADDKVPLSQTQTMVESLRQRGLTLCLKTYPGIQHTMSPEMKTQLMEWVNKQVQVLARGC